jgi:hypothetical protein
VAAFAGGDQVMDGRGVGRLRGPGDQVEHPATLAVSAGSVDRIIGPLVNPLTKVLDDLREAMD